MIIDEAQGRHGKWFCSLHFWKSPSSGNSKSLCHNSIFPFDQCPHVRLQTLPTPSVINIVLPFAQRPDKALICKSF